MAVPGQRGVHAVQSNPLGSWSRTWHSLVRPDSIHGHDRVDQLSGCATQRTLRY